MTSKPSASRYHATDFLKSETLTEMTSCRSKSNGVVSGSSAVSVIAPSSFSMSSVYCFYTNYGFVSIQDLIAIFHHRWSAPVLAELLRQKGSRFVTLGNTLGVGRESLQRTLDSLHGARARRAEPRLRPSAAAGVRPHRARPRVAARCTKLLAALNGDADVVLRKWSLPVLAALRGAEPLHASCGPYSPA